jgi:hypothetical protein
MNDPQNYNVRMTPANLKAIAIGQEPPEKDIDFYSDEISKSGTPETPNTSSGGLSGSLAEKGGFWVHDNTGEHEFSTQDEADAAVNDPANRGKVQYGRLPGKK